MVNKMKYLIEMECEVEGDIAKLREVSTSATEGAEVNITDIEGVNEVSIKLVKATKIVEEEVDLTADEDLIN